MTAIENILHHEIEAAVASPPPRTVPLPATTRLLLALAGTLSLLLFLGGLRTLQEVGKLAWVAAEGRPVTARVASIERCAQSGKNDGSITGLWYTYTDPYVGGVVRSRAQITPVPLQLADADVGSSDAARVRIPGVGEPLRLRVARWAGRSVTYIWVPSPWGHGLFLALCGLVVMAVSLRLLMILSHWSRLRRRLLRDGLAVIGTVTHRHADLGDTPRYFVRYGYGDSARREHWEHEEQVSADQWRRFEVGQPVTVLYDPDEPTRAGLYALIRHA